MGFLLILSIILQIVATVVAIRLAKITKYNFTWILFIIAFSALSFIRYGEYMRYIRAKDPVLPEEFYLWLGILTSICFAVAIFYVRKLFSYIYRTEFQRRLTEKRIVSTVLRTEEKERSRFSKELHDGLGPLLSSAKMSLSALSTRERDAADKELLEHTSYVIEEAVRALREISNNLSPHVLKEFGLARGIANFINKSLAINNIKIRFSTNLKNERFDTDIEVILYRVICELINNSIRHSHGTEINLSLLYNNNTLQLNYSDNGCGFNPQAMMDVGMGLSNICSRVNSIKGTTDITSSKGNGMRACITIDVTPYEHRKI